MRITHLRIYHISCHMILQYMYVCTYVCMSDDIIRSICVLRISNLNFLISSSSSKQRYVQHRESRSAQSAK